MELKYLQDGDEWMLAEDLPEMDFFFSQIWLNSFVNNLENSCGRNYKKILAVYRGYHQQFYYGKNDCLEFTRHIFGKIKADPSYGELTNSNIKKHSDKMAAHAEQEIQNADLSKKSNAELYGLLMQHVKLHTSLYEWGWLSNATDMFYPEFTNYLKGYLREKEKNEGKINAHLVALTAAKEETISAQETRDFLSLAVKIENDAALEDIFAKEGVENMSQKLPSSLRALVEAHWQKYRHLEFMYHGKPSQLEHYYKQLSEFVKANRNAAQELEALNAQVSRNKLRKEELENHLGVDELRRRLFSVFAEFMVTKWYRRNAQILSLYYVEKLLLEICSRFGLSLAEARTMLWREFEEMLVQGKAPARQKLKARFEYFVYYAEKGADAVFVGEEAKKLEAEATKAKIDLSMKELRGQTACLGYGRGRVKIIQRAADMGKMEKGDVLVAYATDPDVVSAMKKAAAIVTEQGGVTCHAAIVSRELGIPCLIGTKVVTKWLKDGDLVEVDATNGLVRKLEG